MVPSHSDFAGVCTSLEARRLQHLLVASFLLSAVVIGISVGVRFGDPHVSLSFYTTPSIAAASIIFDATLLSLTVWQTRRAKANAQALPAGANQPRLRRQRLPYTVRKLSFLMAIALVLLWLGAAVVLMYFLAVFKALELGNEENRKLPAPVVELLLNVAHAIVFGCYAVRSRELREELLYPISSSGAIGLHVLHLP